MKNNILKKSIKIFNTKALPLTIAAVFFLNINMTAVAQMLPADPNEKYSFKAFSQKDNIFEEISQKIADSYAKQTENLMPIWDTPVTNMKQAVERAREIKAMLTKNNASPEEIAAAQAELEKDRVKITPEQFHSQYVKELDKNYKRLISDLVSKKEAALKMQDATADYLAEVEAWEASSKAEIDAWKNKELSSEKAKYNGYCKSFDNYMSETEKITELYIQTISKTLIALHKNYPSTEIRDILLELTPSISALKTGNKDFFSKEDKDYLRGLYRKLISTDNSCDVIQVGTRVISMPGPYVVHDTPDLPQTEKIYGLRNDAGCKRALAALIGLSSIGVAEGVSYSSGRSSDAYVIYDFMTKYASKPSAPSVIISGAAALLALGEYKVLREFIIEQTSIEVKGKDEKLVDKVAYSGIKKYLGPVSQFAQYPAGKSSGNGSLALGVFNNAWEDLAYMLAEDGSPEAEAILKESLNSIHLNGKSADIDAIIPFVTGALLSGKSGIGGFVPRFSTEGEVSLTNYGSHRTNEYEAKASKANAYGLINSLTELGGNRTAGLAAWLYLSGMGDINADTKMALDNKLYKFYKEHGGKDGVIKPYDKNDELYKSKKSTREFAFLGNIFITAAEIALTIWMFWDIAGWAVSGSKLFVSISRAAKMARNGASVAQRAMMLRKMGTATTLIKMRKLASNAKFAGSIAAGNFGVRRPNVVVEFADGSIKDYIRLSSLPKIKAAPVLRKLKPVGILPTLTYPLQRTYQEAYAGLKGVDIYAAGRESLQPVEAKTWLGTMRKKFVQEVSYGLHGKDVYTYGVPEKIVNEAKLYTRQGKEMANSNFRWNEDGTVSAYFEGKTPNTLSQLKNYKSSFEQSDFTSLVGKVRASGFNGNIDMKAHILDARRSPMGWLKRLKYDKEEQFSLLFSVRDELGQSLGVTLKMDKTYKPARTLAGKTHELIFKDGNFFVPNIENPLTFGLRIPKYQLGQFARAHLPGLTPQGLPFLKYNISKTKIPLMLALTGISFSAASTALYIPLTSEPFMSKDGDASKNLITDGEATAVAVFLPYAFSVLSPLAGSWTNKFGAGSTQKMSLMLSLGALSLGTYMGYNGFIKEKDREDIKMWPIFAAAGMIGIGSAFNRSAMDVLTNRYKIGNFSSTRMFAKNVAGLASYLPPLLYHGYHSLSTLQYGGDEKGNNKKYIFPEPLRMESTGDFSSTYPVLGALALGALIYMQNVKLASGINKIENYNYFKGVVSGFKAMGNKEVLPYIGGLTLFAGFEGQAFFKTTNNFVKNQLHYEKLTPDSMPQKLAALGTGAVMAFVPGLVRFKTPASESLNIPKFITGSVLASATGAALLWTEDPRLGWLGYGLMGYGTANMYTGLRQGLINNLMKKGLYSDVKFQTNAMSAFTAGNMGVGVLPWINSKLVIDPRKEAKNETSLEAGTRTMWSNLLMLGGGSAIAHHLGLFSLSMPKNFIKGVKVGNMIFTGNNLLNGRPFTEMKFTPEALFQNTDVSKGQPAFINFDTKLAMPELKLNMNYSPVIKRVPAIKTENIAEAEMNEPEMRESEEEAAGAADDLENFEGELKPALSPGLI